MKKRLAALAAICALVAGAAAVVPTPAIAADNDSVCVVATASLTIDNVNKQFDTHVVGECGNGGGDFAAGDDFQLIISVQYNSGGSWFTASCVSGGCKTTKPSGTTNCGSYFCNFTEHTVDSTFNSTNSNLCTGEQYRTHVQAVIRDGDTDGTLNWNSAVKSC